MYTTSSAASGLFLLFFCLIGLVAIASIVFWIWAIVDCANNEPSGSNDKTVWLLVIIFGHSVGGIIYLLVRRPERKRLFGR